MALTCSLPTPTTPRSSPAPSLALSFPRTLRSQRAANSARGAFYINGKVWARGGRGPARAGLMTHPCGFGQAAGLSHSRRDKRLPSKNPPAGALWAAWVRHVCGVRPTEVGRGLRGPIPAPETCSLGGEVPWPVVHTRD